MTPVLVLGTLDTPGVEPGSQPPRGGFGCTLTAMLSARIQLPVYSRLSAALIFSARHNS